MSLMEMFANPETFSSLSIGDKLAGAGITTLMGMGITFTILILLWLFITLMNKIIMAVSGNNKKTDATSVTSPAATAAPTPVAAPVAESEVVEKNDELIAVITAAIAACEENTVSSNLVIRKISRVSGHSPAWASAGRGECIESRRVF